MMFNFLFAMITPFLAGTSYVVDEGGATPEEEVLLGKVKAKAAEAFSEFKAQTISKEAFDLKMTAIENEIKTLNFKASIDDLTKTINEIKAQSNEQGVEITKIKNIGNAPCKTKSLIDGIKELLNHNDIKAYIDNGAKGQSVQVKTLVDITQATAITAGSTLPTQLLGGMPVHAPERKISMTDIISVGSTETETVTFNQEYEFEDGISTLTENQATAKSSFKVRPVSLTAGRIGTHLIVSKRSLKNEKYLLSHISKRLPQKMKKAEDAQILLGTGAGSTLVGLCQNASVFAAGAFAGTIPAAQEIDCLLVAISQLTQGEYEASGIILNPVDAAKIELIKSTTRDYVDSGRAVRGADGILRVAGLKVVETTAMTAGKFLVGDFNMACDWLLFTPLTMSISDSHASIFLNNEVCINFEEEPVFPIYNPLMFVYGQFSVAKAAITSGS